MAQGRHTFRDLEEYPRFERIQHFPSCKIPCFHFLTGGNVDSVHATFTKGDRIPQVLNTLFDLSINNCHNQAILFDRIQLLSRYITRQRQFLSTIPEEKPLPDERIDFGTLRSDLREIKSQQTRDNRAEGFIKPHEHNTNLADTNIQRQNNTIIHL